MNFCGKYSGKFNKTVINSAGTTPSKGTAEVTISEVGCGAYLINIVKSTGDSYNNLAYLENDVLRASSGGNGIFSAYFEDNKLIAQASNKSNNPDVWTVVNYSLKKCKC